MGDIDHIAVAIVHHIGVAANQLLQSLTEESKLRCLHMKLELAELEEAGRQAEQQAEQQAEEQRKKDTPNMLRHPYGFCAHKGCDAPGVKRSPLGEDKCAKGHTYPSNKAEMRLDILHKQEE